MTRRPTGAAALRFALLLCLGHFLIASSGSAQKPPVDTGAFAKWPWVGNPAISNDGNYAAYSIWSWGSTDSTVLRALQGDWKVVLPGVERATFTDDSRSAVFLKTKDTLGILRLGSTAAEYLSPVVAFRLFTHGPTEWLAYQSGTPEKQLALRNLTTGVHHAFSAVAEYALSQDGNTLALLTESRGDSARGQTVSWVRLADGQRTDIWHGRKARHLVLDAHGVQLAFSVDSNAGTDTSSAVWYYRTGAPRPLVLADDRSRGIDRGLHLDEAQAFSHDGRRLFVTLKEEELKPNPGAVNVDVWSYTDAKLQSQQFSELRESRARSYLAVIGVDAPHRVLRLQQADEQRADWGKIGDFVLFDRRQGDVGDYNWAITGQPSYALVSTKTGERKTIQLLDAELSPGEKYVMGYDVERKNIYRYDVATGVTRNLTGSLPIPLVDRDVTLEPQSQYRPLGIARWLPNDEAVLIFDRFDIWQIDPSGRKAPVNLTNGYGRRQRIVFRFPKYGTYSAGRSLACVDSECRILSAFNEITKDDGYYRLSSRSHGDPELLTMGPYAYFSHRLGPPLPMPPMKARDADVYLLQRESAAESRNWFGTRDFTSFFPVSDVRPERQYIWPTAELATFRTLNGHTVQGVLYKPGDFDPRKRYPVILHYYEKKSDDLNQFRRPGDGGELDIIWFASHGYLVFTPDIYNTMGGNGQDAMNSIIAAANYLRPFPWVDARKMGLQGHSFGGYYTNYVIAQSTRFAAAVAAAASANIISEYGDLWGSGVSKKELVENRHYRMNASLWDRPDWYIKNSPIFYADRVTTPLLMVANKRDRNVSFAQGVEFFTALRRLGKRVWMLQYDEGDHGVSGKDRTDYIVRMTQFFDHYLKGAPAPRWMTQGVPARLKGTETRLELDEPGKTPGAGLLLPPRSPARGRGERPRGRR